MILWSLNGNSCRGHEHRTIGRDRLPDFPERRMVAVRPPDARVFERGGRKRGRMKATRNSRHRTRLYPQTNPLRCVSTHHCVTSAPGQDFYSLVKMKDQSFKIPSGAKSRTACAAAKVRLLSLESQASNPLCNLSSHSGVEHNLSNGTGEAQRLKQQ